jgi:hypothetical protein
MNLGDLDTVEKIAQYTKDKVRIYRQYQSKKKNVVEELALLFAEEAEGWKVVVDMGKFRNGFTRVLGVRGMKAHKKLLYELDQTKYQEIDFEVDG